MLLCIKKLERNRVNYGKKQDYDNNKQPGIHPYVRRLKRIYGKCRKVY